MACETPQTLQVAINSRSVVNVRSDVFFETGSPDRTIRVEDEVRVGVVEQNSQNGVSPSRNYGRFTPMMLMWPLIPPSLSISNRELLIVAPTASAVCWGRRDPRY